MNITRLNRIYYNAEIVNQTNAPIPASYSATLLKPIINEPKKYNLNVNRFRLPLNSVPLSRKNLPFSQWSVGIGYSQNQDNNFDNQLEIVHQINETIQLIPTYAFLDNSATGFYQATENNFNNDYNQSLTTAQGIKQYDTVGNGTIYVLNSNTGVINAYDSKTQQLIATILTTKTNIQSWIVNKQTSDIYINNATGTFKFTRNGNIWTQSPIQFNTTGLQSSLSYFLFLLDGFLVGYCNAQAVPPPAPPKYALIMWDLVDGSITSGGYVPYNESQLHSYYVISDGISYFYISSSLDNHNTITKNYLQSINGNYTVVSPITYNIETTSTPYNLCGFDPNGNLMISRLDNIEVYTTQAEDYSIITSPLYYFTDPISGTLASSTIALPTQKTLEKLIDNPNVTINSYQEFLDQINASFSTVWNNLLASYPSIDQTVKPPIIIYNPTSKLFCLICDGEFLDNTKFRIYLNSNLWNMFLFPTYINNQAPSDDYGLMMTISIKNNIFNSVYSSQSVNPEYITVYQESSTRFKFYDLARILVTTNKLPVDGDIEDINSQLNAITDVIPDIDDLTPDSILIYQPTILREYNLDSSNPIYNIDIHFYYGCKDGTIHRVYLQPSEYASIKLGFFQAVE